MNLSLRFFFLPIPGEQNPSGCSSLEWALVGCNMGLISRAVLFFFQFCTERREVLVWS